MGRVGFCTVEVKPFGPVHAYVAPATVGVESAIVAPAQYGPPFDAVGVAGVEMGTGVEFVARQPLGATIDSVSVTLPEGPAVYEIDCDAVLP